MDPLNPRVSVLVEDAFFRFQLVRLRLERLIGTFRPKSRRRVLAIATWGFPNYSQTFVYQELAQLIRAGFGVRLAFSGLNKDPLAPQFLGVWRARRRLILSQKVSEDSLAYFGRVMPERVDRLVELLSEASGATADDIRNHYHFKQAFAFARMAEAYRPRYIHSYFFYEGTLFAYVASYLLGIPRGVSCYADHMLDDYPLKVVGLHLRQCRIVVATSERIKSELVAIEPHVAAGKILVKPNGINVSQFPLIDRPVQVKGDVLGLVSVSRIAPKKGLLQLVEAVAILRDRGQSVRVHVIGTTDQDDASKEYGRALSDRIAELDLTDLIHLEGRRSEAEINDFFGRSHIFVAPYIETEAGDKDGIPTALLEAMSSGLAVVATDAGSISEVIENGQEGLIVPQRNPEALAGAISQLIASPQERMRLGSNASERVRASLDASLSEHSFHERVSAVVSEAQTRSSTGQSANELEDPQLIDGPATRSSSAVDNRDPGSEDNPPESPPESPTGDLVGMTMWEERQFLYHYAKDEYDGTGAIVDLGCWLGSATASLAAGLVENPDPRVAQTRVDAFDLFRWEPEMENYLFGDAQAVTLKAGDSFLPWFESQLGPLLGRVNVIAGDLSQVSWDGGAISLLFNDASKSWPLANALWRNFYPHCLPNRSLVVEQDYAHYYTFWIHLLHWRYQDTFAHVMYVPGSTSVVFRPLQTIVFERDLDFSDFSEQDITDAFERSLGLVEPTMRPNVWAARVMLEIHRGNRPRAQELFDEAPGRGFYGLELDLVSHLLDPTQR